MATWSQLKRILILHLVNKGIAPGFVPGFVRCLVTSIKATSRLDIQKVKQRMHYMGWNECEIDDDTLGLAIACFNAQGFEHLKDKPARWFEKKFKTAQ